jgi:thioredoxin reductase (NADPH)
MKQLDCLVIGGGPAGLTAATYLARFKRRFLLIHSGQSRAALIPTTHNYPGFGDGIAGVDLLDRMRGQATKYGAEIVPGTIQKISRASDHFVAQSDSGVIHARTVLFATGVVDIEPPLAAWQRAIKMGLIRHCCICDGFEATGLKIGVIGHGEGGLEEALFLRTYSADISLLSLGEKLKLSAQHEAKVQDAGIEIVEEAIESIDTEKDRIIKAGIKSGKVYRFDTLYSALGALPRTDTLIGLGVSLFEDKCIEVDSHMRTNIPGLYAAGDVIKALDQISTAIGNAAIAATAIHNQLRGQVPR